MEDVRKALVDMTGDAELIQRLIANEEKLNDPYGLTVLERVVVRLWSSPNPWYKYINSMYRGQKTDPAPSSQLRLIGQMLRDAVVKLPRYNGLCFRGERDFPGNVVYAQASDINWPCFNSASADRLRAYPGDTLFAIASINGRRLQGYAVDDSEQEILFLPNSWFNVVGIANSYGRKMIQLVEFDGGAVKNP
jgi:hypothetical protein